MISRSTLHRLLEARAAAPPDAFDGPDAGRPLSFAQQRLWFLQQLAPADTAYHAPIAYRLRGALDVEALRRAIELVVQRHEALRTAFPGHDGVPRQVVYQLARLHLHVTSLASIDAADREEALAQLIDAEVARPFDLSAAPPLRAWLLRVADDDHVLLFTLHHLVIDDASFDVLWRELGAAYDGAALEPVRTQYPEYAAAQRARITDAVLARQLAYWQRQLAGAPARTELPYRHARLLHASPPREYALDLGAETSQALRALATQTGATLFMAGLAALRAVLARTTGQDDLCIGAPITTRNRPALRDAIGFFVNTLALRTPVDVRTGFAALLRAERATMLDAFERLETPFERIVQALGLERDGTTNPLFQLTYSHHPPRVEALQIGSLAASVYEIPRGAAQFDLEVDTLERGESIVLRCSYKRERFEDWVIEGLAQQLACFVREAVRAPELPIARVPLVDADARRLLLERARVPEHEATDLTLRGMFEAQVDRTPDATALVLGDARLTYRQLDERANQIAAALRAHGIGPERVAGVALERSFDQVAAIIGVIKAGGAWVPLDPSLPASRLRYIADVAGARAVVSAGDGHDLGLPVVDVTSTAVTSAPTARAGADGLAADHLAYVLFTSGSTGQPKGVMITHRAIRNELAVSNHALRPMGPGEALLALAPFTFDQSVHEMWWPLVHGAALVLVADGEQRDPERVVERIQQAGVTVLELVPTLLRALVVDRGLARCPSLRLVAAGGEALTLELMRAHYAASPELPLINGYGPTETAVTVCNWRCPPDAEAMVIGDAWANVQFRVLDELGELVPLGVAGELFIGGLQLARGYASRPDLTAERFVPDPFAAEPGRRMYRTGDRVRRLPDGTIEFLGRVDAQVKLRGFRIELGEIEAALLEHEAIAACAVALRPSARGDQLVAYLVPRASLEVAALRAALAGRLPEYMIPAAYVELAALPLTPSGKLDRRALPAPSETAFERAPMLAPRTPAEVAIAAIWREVLGVDEVGVRDDFFARGGHSLLAVQVVARIRAELGAPLTLAQLFRAPTIEGLAHELAQAAPAAPTAPVAAPRDEPLLPSYAQQRLWLVDQLTPDSSAYHMPTGRRLHGPLDPEALRRAFEDVVHRHEILRTSFPAEDGLPHQHVHPPARWELPVDDLAGVDPGAREAHLARISREDAEARFDLAAGPLLRTRLVRLAPDDHVVLVTMHHIVSDGWSHDVFWREVDAAYAARRAGHAPALPALALQYADFAAQQRVTVDADALAAHLAYWKQHLAGAPAETALPRRAHRAAAGPASELIVAIGGETTRALRELGRREGATLFMILLAAFRAVLARTTGQDDLVIGSPSSGRDRAELEGLIGLFVNTLVLRGEVDRAATFAELVRRERATVLDAYAHQDAPFEMIVDELGVDRSAARSPIFQIWFVQESVGRVAAPAGDLVAEPFARGLADTKFELSVYVNEAGERVELALMFDTAVLDRRVVEGLADRFRTALELAAGAPDRSFAELELGAPPPGNDPRVALPVPAYPPVLEVIEQLARAAPDAPALRHAGRELSRAALWAASTRVVEALAGAGVQPGERVALAGAPSVGLIAGYLGVLRHGACLVPLSSRLSREHAERLLAHVDARVILDASGARTSARVPTATLDAATGAIAMPAQLPPPARPADPAIKYIYFTSGTTGAQKAVIGNLVALGHFSAWQRAELGEVAGPVSALLTELGFDVFLRDSMFALTSGKVMALPPNEVAELEPAELVRWLDREGVTAIHTVPSLLRTWLEHSPADVHLRALGCIFLVGEPLDATLVERWRARFGAQTEIVNLYGTTETGPAKCWYRVPHPPEPGIQPAGWPLPESQLLIVRGPRALAAVGEVGEVVIRTPFSTLGYLDADASSEPKFLTNPFRADPADRMYRTGDLGRYRPDGAVEILGRIDDQVKLRGQRVDPSGIAAALRSHRGVADAAVIAVKLTADDVRLIAYVVRTEPAAPTSELREHLRQTIPPYMIPASFVFLGALPRKANGKLDRAALPAPDWDAGDADVFVPPRTPEEEAIAAVWRDVLRVERIGVRDDFFALGGHSLLAVMVTSRLRAVLEVDVGIQRFFETPTIEGLAAHVARLRGGATPDAAPPPITVMPRGGSLPLSFAQQRLWFLHRLAPTSPAYHVPLQRRVRGRLALEALRRAFEDVVRRHESLRTVFPSDGGVPLQRIDPPARWELPLEDGDLERVLRDEAERPFDLAAGPLFRTKVVRIAEDDHVVLVTLHHIISDGWSMGVMWSEVAELYWHHATGAPARLPALPIQYADYAAWQRAWLSGATLDRHLAYWVDQLHDAPSETALPIKGPRPAVSTARGGMVALELDAELTAAVKAVNKATRATSFVTLLAAFRAVLARITGQDDLCIGTPIAGRGRHELEHVIGIMLNTLVLRTPIAPGDSFTELVKRERANALAAYAHQDAPFEMVVDALKIERSLNRTPLYQVSFVHQNLPQAARPIGDLVDEPFVGRDLWTRFDLSVVSFERDGKLQLELIYNLDLFDRWQIEQLAAHYACFLREALRTPARAVAAIPIMPAAEQQRLVAAWNRPPEPARPLTLPAMVEAQVDRTPDAIALVLGDATLTYRELDARANRIAHALRARGVGPETLVGVALERSFDLVAAILGVSKAGGAWVPLDPHLPAARLAAITEVARPAVVVDAAWIAGTGAEPAHRPAPIALAPEHLAYVLFTSGSTGQPKGVMIHHAGIVNELISAQTLRAQLGPADRFLQLAPYTFDLSVHEMLWPLTTGAGVVLLPEGAHREPRRILDEVRARGVTIMHPVPALLRALLAERDGLDRCPTLRVMCSGGEALPLDVLHAFTALRPDVALINSYGPTEASVTVSGWRCPSDATGVAIGQPYLGTQMYVLDDHLAPAPLGVAGELYLGGVQLARGYAAQPALTASAFVPDPFAAAPGARMYRTGDRARRWPDGNVELLGRVDRQVKVRGFRIELGEIEAALRAHPDVREAAVLVHGAGADARLVAYVVGAHVSADGLRTFLAGRLPEYMVPRAVVSLDAMPLTRSGKLDRNALPAPDDAGLERDRDEAPRTPLEELLAGIWAELLGVERISRNANFFDLGGHSLLAARLAWESKTSIATVFAAPTIATLAAAIEAQGRDGTATTAPPLVAVERSGALALSHAQQRMWFLHALQPDSPAYHMSLGRRLRGSLDVETLRRACQDVIERHEVLRSSFPLRDGVPHVEVHAPAIWSLPVDDLVHVPPAQRAAELDRLSRAETERRFDLATGPLLRTRLVRLAPDEHVLLVTLHHIVFDGSSIALFWHELEELYSARVEGRPARLSGLAIQYVDHAQWQRTWSAGELLEHHLAYWKEHLDGAPEDTALPFKGPRPPVQTHHGAAHTLTLSPELAHRVRELARAHGSTLFITLLAALRALLLRYTGQDDVCIGAPAANRNQREVEALLGLFVNTVVFRTRTSGEMTFAELLESERATALEAFAHTDAPLEMVIETLQITRTLSRNPLFQVMFQVLFADAGPPDVGFTGLTVEHVERGLISTHVDLDISAIVDGDRIDLVFVYNSDLFDAAPIAQLAGHFDALLAAAVAEPETPLDALGVLAPPEEERLLRAWNATDRDVPRTTLPALLAERIARTPDAVAIESGGRTLTYGALAEQANRLARHLLALGLAPEERVGVRLDRGPELVIAMLGVLTAGGAYLPLDGELPADRLAYMIEDARVRIVLDDPHLFAVEGPLAALSPDALDVALAPERLAYVLYTSGSTGRPKGVQIQHASLVNFLSSMLDAPGLTAGDTLLAVTTASFDISGLELYLPLLAGARLVIATRDDARDGARLAQLLDEHQVTVMQATPSTWRLLVELGWQPRPGFVALCGGEALPPDLANALAPRVAALWNLYGPTETTIWSARKRIEAGAPIRLGEPIANTQLYILDPGTLRVQPLEVAGELYIAGAGLARGYGDRPDLTASRFLPDPFARVPGARMYRTGDLARRRTDGEIEFLGRIDHQVKVRGFRIELGEIEAVLADEPHVAEVVVVVREDGGEPRLVAYVVSLGAAPTVAALMELARARLPDYMVPSAVVFLDELPLSPAGKLDRRALPAPDREAFGAVAYQAPRGPIEEVLAEIWAQLLEVDRVGAHDNFFDLGGHSLLALRMITVVGSRLAVELPVRDIFETPTLEGIAAKVTALSHQQEGYDLRPPFRPAGARRAPLLAPQRGTYLLERHAPANPLNRMPTSELLDGPLDVHALEQALDALRARHAILRSRLFDDAGEQWQEQLDHVEAPILQHVDLSTLSAPEQARREAELHEQLVTRPFALGEGEVMRALLVTRAHDRHRLSLVVHRVVCDPPSLALLVDELYTLWRAFITDPIHAPSVLAPVAAQYLDLADYVASLEQSGFGERQRAYWQTRLAGATPLVLPTDAPRGPVDERRAALGGYATFPIESTKGALSAETTTALERVARDENTTLMTVLLAAMAAYLSERTGQQDLAITSHLLYRHLPGLDRTPGLYPNPLIMRISTADAPTFHELVARTHETVTSAFDHGDADVLGGAPELFGRLFFNYLDPVDDAGEPTQLPDVTRTPCELPGTYHYGAGYDLILSLRRREDRVDLSLMYNTELFREDGAARLLRGYIESVERHASKGRYR